MDFFDIMDEHKALLKKCGYDEAGLDSPDRPGRFAERIQGRFSNALKAALVESITQQFSVSVAGFFDNNKDLVDFSFQYECNPRKAGLFLKSVTARLEDVRKEIMLGANEDLIPAKKVYELLLKERNVKNEIIQPDETVALNQQRQGPKKIR